MEPNTIVHMLKLNYLTQIQQQLSLTQVGLGSNIQTGLGNDIKFEITQPGVTFPPLHIPHFYLLVVRQTNLFLLVTSQVNTFPTTIVRI